MLLWVGLGNPEPGMARQRHNIGFMALDTIAIRHGFSPWRQRFKGLVAEGTVGGEKVFPEEVEEALKAQPGIEDALVVGRPDEVWGKIVVAIIRSAGPFDEAKVRAGLAKTLSTYKHPKKFVNVEVVPRHESGKADYRRAVALAEG